MRGNDGGLSTFGEAEDSENMSKSWQGRKKSELEVKGEGIREKYRTES